MAFSYSFGNVSLPSSPEESSPVGHSPPMIFPAMIPANLQGLMDLGMQLAAHAQQIRLPDFEDNRESDGASPASSVEEVPVHVEPKMDGRYPKKVCRICRIEEATVSHFGVDVCTGCRAFFRRSVGQQKTYRCLNGKLCGRDTCKSTEEASL
ncbi:hypothetical protein AAVH_24009 [Aphelenchoides avenae]|nr:hypothetical protein AAVH_24009 [Aphelenchus avenae]